MLRLIGIATLTRNRPVRFFVPESESGVRVR
jgi:hypothetical protein